MGKGWGGEGKDVPRIGWRDQSAGGSFRGGGGWFDGLGGGLVVFEGKEGGERGGGD